MKHLMVMTLVLCAFSAAQAEPHFSKGKRPVSTGLPFTAALSVESCEGCHPAEAREWAGSRHRQSWTGSLFQEAYALEPRAECRNCHQPLTSTIGPRAVTPLVKELRSEGVNCVTCHVREGVIHSSKKSGRAPHAVKISSRMSTADFCGGCHQFAFPERNHQGKLVRDTDEPMQDTLGEWRRAVGRGATVESCQGCHMPYVQTPSGRWRRSHGFPGGYDPSVLARSVSVRASAERGAETTRIEVTLMAQNVGHSVPTGDLYRSLVVEAVLVDPITQAPLPGAKAVERRLSRRFANFIEKDGVRRRRQVADDRLVPGEPQTVRLVLPSNPRARIRYRVLLGRLPPAQKETRAPASALISVVSTGIIPIAREKPLTLSSAKVLP